MNYQLVLKSLKKFTYYNIINYYKPILENKLRTIFFNKKKIYLRNSSKAFDIAEKIIGKNIDFNELETVSYTVHAYKSV